MEYVGGGGDGELYYSGKVESDGLLTTCCLSISSPQTLGRRESTAGYFEEALLKTISVVGGPGRLIVRRTQTKADHWRKPMKCLLVMRCRINKYLGQFGTIWEKERDQKFVLSFSLRHLTPQKATMHHHTIQERKRRSQRVRGKN